MAKETREKALPSDLDPSGGAVVDASGVVTSGAGDRALLLEGSLSRAEYLELQIERALAPLVGQLDAERLEAMREVLRAELANDPILVELAERATQGN